MFGEGRTRPVARREAARRENLVLDWTGKACTQDERLRTKKGIDSRCVKTANRLTGAHEGATEKQGCGGAGKLGVAIVGERANEGRRPGRWWAGMVWRFCKSASLQVCKCKSANKLLSNDRGEFEQGERKQRAATERYEKRGAGEKKKWGGIADEGERCVLAAAVGTKG